MSALLDSVAPVVAEPVSASPAVVIGLLVGFGGEGLTPLVTFAGQPGTAALSARSTVDLHGAHIGAQVVLAFDRGDPHLPIVLGWLRQEHAFLSPSTGNVDVEGDGERLIVSAKEQIVLRCGKASITLTKAGKVLIEGAYVLSHSSAVNRIKGGSVEIN
jgi:hypothetical protein